MIEVFCRVKSASLSVRSLEEIRMNMLNQIIGMNKIPDDFRLEVFGEFDKLRNAHFTVFKAVEIMKRGHNE